MEAGGGGGMEVEAGKVGTNQAGSMQTVKHSLPLHPRRHSGHLPSQRVSKGKVCVEATPEHTQNPEPCQVPICPPPLPPASQVTLMVFGV